MFNIFNILKNRNVRPSVRRGSAERTSANVQPILYGAILVFFITISLFSSFIISYHLEGNCLSSIFSNENCPVNGLAEIEHHLALPHMFGEVIPVSLTIFSLLSVLGIVGLLLVFRKLRLVADSFKYLSFLRKRNNKSFSRISPTTISWLSLFELSPSL